MDEAARRPSDYLWDMSVRNDTGCWVVGLPVQSYWELTLALTTRAPGYNDIFVNTIRSYGINCSAMIGKYR